MKKIRLLTLILAVCLMLSVMAPAAYAVEDPNLGAQAVIIADMDSGRILYGKNEDEQRAPASLTKIMTVLVAIESIEKGEVGLDDVVTAQSDCLAGLEQDSSTAGIVAGEQMSLQDLLYCAMVHSANEACNIIAYYISGSVSGYLDRMNARAAELGCTATHFSNTNGLPGENHYSTARDLMIITNAAMKHDLFYRICNTVTYTVPATNVSGERVIENSNALISTEGIYGGSYLYQYASGVKTGYTRAAGYCLISTASKNGINAMVIVLGCNGLLNSDSSEYTNFVDSIAAYNWVFDNFSHKEIVSTYEDIKQVQVDLADDDGILWLRPQTSLEALVSNDLDLDSKEIQTNIYTEKLVAPISAGTVLGEMRVSFNGTNYGTLKLVASRSIELSKGEYLKMRLATILDNKLVKTILIILAVLLVLYIALVSRYRYLRKKHLKEKRLAEKRRRAELERRRREREAQMMNYRDDE